MHPSSLPRGGQRPFVHGGQSGLRWATKLWTGKDQNISYGSPICDMITNFSTNKTNQFSFLSPGIPSKSGRKLLQNPLELRPPVSGVLHPPGHHAPPLPVVLRSRAHPVERALFARRTPDRSERRERWSGWRRIYESRRESKVS